MLGVCACAKAQPAAAPAKVSQAEEAPTTPAANNGADKLVLDLNGQRVEITLPSPWKMLDDQSDSKMGIVAFAPEGWTPGRTDSLFLDGSREARVPGSLDEAVAEVLEDCVPKGACTELGRASLPAGGMLVSARKPHAIFVETWQHAPSRRIVRCGAEASDLTASSETTWMKDEAAVTRARTTAEQLCRSVKLLP
jgi:hypothetical protein